MIQPLVDAVKIFQKEHLQLRAGYHLMLVFSPILLFILLFLLLFFLPQLPIQGSQGYLWNISVDSKMASNFAPQGHMITGISFLYFIVISELFGVVLLFSVLFLCSPLSYFAALRRVHISMAFSIFFSQGLLGLVALTGSLDAHLFFQLQGYLPHLLLSPCVLPLFTSGLLFLEAEKVPMDLSEAESELAHGETAEYTSFLVALLFGPPLWYTSGAPYTNSPRSVTRVLEPFSMRLL